MIYVERIVNEILISAVNLFTSGQNFTFMFLQPCMQGYHICSNRKIVKNDERYKKETNNDFLKVQE